MIRFFSSLVKKIFKQEPATTPKPVIPETEDKKPLPREEEPPPAPPRQPPPPPQAVDKTRPAPPRPQKPRWTLDKFQVPEVEGKTRFHDLDLPLNLMRGIAQEKFEYCMPVQAEVLPHTLKGRDATAKAQTGTGKSAAFLVTIIARLLNTPLKGKRMKGMPRALILAPTRELVLQIEKDAKALTRYTPLRTISVFGGMDYRKQQEQLKSSHVDIIAATPGRLIDFMQQKLVIPGKVEILVLDEADRMLDMGFIPDMRKIIYATPHKKERQTLFFSATLAPEILRMATQWTVDPAMVEIDPDKTAADSINQKVYIVTEDEKFPLLYNLVTGENLDRVIVFVNRRDTTRKLAHKLQQYGLRGEILSGEVSQKQRLRTLEDFRKGKVRLLVATDVAARGLHIDGVSHVINYDLPQDPEHYVHRIGRTGRAGAEGISVSFADEMSSFYIPDIEKVLGNSLECEYPEEEMLAALPKPKKIARPKPKQKPGSGRKPGQKSDQNRRRRPQDRNRPPQNRKRRRPPRDTQKKDTSHS
ncbi:MAG: DEAD/DEAH box helicase [Desulfobacteraceae bacterium]|nr:DEAD/DEAH box helicase [Desulfobacteraceae bacterium]